MSCECPNQQQLCDPVRGLPYNPSGIPFIDEELEDDAHQLHAVIVCNDLRSPEAQGLIRKDLVQSKSEKCRRPKANDTRIALPDRGQNQTRSKSGSLRRSFQGLAKKVRRNSIADSSDGHTGIICNRNACKAMMMGVLLSAAYFLLAAIAAVVTYSLIADLLESLRHPVHSVRYKQVNAYDPPGIVVYPGDASLMACGYYFQEKPDSYRSLSDLDPGNRTCTYINVSYANLDDNSDQKSAIVIKGPSDVSRRETLFVHFWSEKPQREYFTVSYFLFPGWSRFNGSSGELELSYLLARRRKEPPLALSAGFQFWIKMSIHETLLIDKDTNIDMKAEHTIIKHWDSNPGQNRKSQIHFLFFEWKNDLVQETYALCTTSAWQVGACVCAIFLGLHKLYNFVKAGVKKAKRRKLKRKYSSLNSKEQKTDVDDHSCECACSEAADKSQSCDNES